VGDRWNGGQWADRWQDHHVRDRYGDWYNGCWTGAWDNNGYAPLAYGALGWGLGNLTGWGYGDGYYNPYYEPVSGSYDYSEPVAVADYAPADATSAETAQEPVPEGDTKTQEALQKFDQALAFFKEGEYSKALVRCNSALKQMPNDPVLHEVRALCLFALGRYKQAAAALDSLLASAPGMDWTTMSNLYGNTDDYTKQLRTLESYVTKNREDTAAAFVLVYHYLVIGETDRAIRGLKRVVAQQPKDATARRMLAALTPPEPPADETPPAGAPPQTDLVGKWSAKSGKSTIQLSIDDKSQFTWRATAKDKPLEIKGQLLATSDTLVLEGQNQGTMVGKVKAGGPDKFEFRLAGMPASDAGLMFARLK